jgi:hypothetical protein
VSLYYVLPQLFTSAGYIPDYLNRNLALQVFIQLQQIVLALQVLVRVLMEVGVVVMVGVVAEFILEDNLPLASVFIA